METKALILVTYARQYDIDSTTKGTSVNYFILNPDGSFMKQDEDGQQNAKVSMAYEDRIKFTEVPAVYEGSFTMTIGSDRKPTLRLMDAVFHAPVLIRGLDPENIKSPLDDKAASKPGK